jgi:hypothetical protein
MHPTPLKTIPFVASLGPHGQHRSSVAKSGNYLAMSVVYSYYPATAGHILVCLAVVALHQMYMSQYTLNIFLNLCIPQSERQNVMHTQNERLELLLHNLLLGCQLQRL